MPNGQSYILWACKLVPLPPAGHSIKKCMLLDCHMERDVGGKAKQSFDCQTGGFFNLLGSG